VNRVHVASRVQCEGKRLAVLQVRICGFPHFRSQPTCSTPVAILDLACYDIIRSSYHRTCQICLLKVPPCLREFSSIPRMMKKMILLHYGRILQSGFALFYGIQIRRSDKGGVVAEKYYSGIHAQIQAHCRKQAAKQPYFCIFLVRRFLDIKEWLRIII